MGKIAQWTSIVFFQLVLVSGHALAEEVPFSEVWGAVSKASPGMKAAQLQLQSSQEAEARAGRHWLPRLYLDAKSYQTNDSGAVFFGLLQQRSLQQNDFNPQAINHPEAQVFTRGALGIDLPLYEGGMKTAQASLQSHLSRSAEQEAHGVGIMQYSQVAQAYGSIGLLLQQKQKIQNEKQTVDRLLKSYQIGVKSNPVGYSGLLGLNSLSHRLEGLLRQYEAQVQAAYLILKEMGFSQDGWIPKNTDTRLFVEKYMGSQPGESSSQIESLKAKADMAEEMSKMEQARYLPRIGAFAENYVFNGKRDTADGYTAGVYLQWNLFNPADYGTHKEAQIKSLAAREYSLAMAQKERAESLSLDQGIQALKENIRLVEESQKIMLEQTRVAEGLFKNGSINALQFVEVLNRKVDLTVSESEVNLNLLQSSAQKILKTRFELPSELTQGQ